MWGPNPPDLILSVPSNPIAYTSIYLYIFLASFTNGVKRTKAHISPQILSLFLCPNRKPRAKESVSSSEKTNVDEKLRIRWDRIRSTAIWIGAFSISLRLRISFCRCCNLVFVFALLRSLSGFLKSVISVLVILINSPFFFVSNYLSSLRFSLLFDCLFFLD